MSYNVFISYRREGGDTTARMVQQLLLNKKFSPFLDAENIRKGKFNDQLLSVINECDFFILILTPHALDRCINKDDWVRLEIEQALSRNKNIIPFMTTGFQFPDQLPDSINDIRNYQGVQFSTTYFEASMQNLFSLLSSSSASNAPVLMKHSHTASLVPIVDRLYDTLVVYSREFAHGTQESYIQAMTEMTDAATAVYDYAIRSQISAPNESQAALSIIQRYNTFAEAQRELSAVWHTSNTNPARQKLQHTYDQLIRHILECLASYKQP